MKLKDWAIANGLEEVYNQYKKECEEIAEQCEAEGYPAYGSNYELRVDNIEQYYPELFEEYYADEYK